VQAALHNNRLGLIDNWLRHVQDVRNKHRAALDDLPSDAARLNRLCELNVIEQVFNVCQTTIVQSAWDRGKKLEVHGWIYDLHDGLLKDLAVCIESTDEFARVQRALPSR
jgi:carbonic anhydrase